MTFAYSAQALLSLTLCIGAGLGIRVLLNRGDRR